MEQPSDYAWITLAILGAIAAFSGWLYTTHALATWDWPHAVATITRASDVTQCSEEGVIWYACEFEFEYSVGHGGVRTVEKSINFNEEETAQIVRNRRQPGTQFDLYYRPGNPDSVLINGPKNPGHGYSLAIDGVTLTAATAPLLIWDLHWGIPTAVGVIGVVLGIYVHNRWMSKKYPFVKPFPHTSSYLR